MNPTIRLRQANIEDEKAIRTFLRSSIHLHRHLDWRDALEWLGVQPVWLLEDGKGIQAVMICSEDPSGTAWLRLFAVSFDQLLREAWDALFAKVKADFTSRPNPPLVAILALQDWIAPLVAASGFQSHQKIVVLSFERSEPQAIPAPRDVTFRHMTKADLPAVAELDNLAFEPLWSLSEGDIFRAFERCQYSTLMVRDGQIVGYQMSTMNGFSAHLARLAVHPRCQRAGFATFLVAELLQHFLVDNHLWNVTVNTQSDNLASLALYERMGFRLTGESYPVLTWQPPARST